MNEVTVALVDDHRVVRAGIRLLLDSAEGIRVVGEAGSLEEARALLEECVADVLVLDLGLGDGSGLSLLDDVSRGAGPPRVVVLTMHESNEYLWAALRKGAAGYVLKGSADEDLVTAIRAVAAGGAYVDSDLTAALVAGVADASSSGTAAGSGPAEVQLSHREQQVLCMVALGHTNAEIGQELYLSVKTVETYRSRAMSKLGLTTRADVVRHALRADWLSGTPDTGAPEL